jgi:uncharacterized membrane protein
MTFESSKTLGGVGALLMFIGIFPYIDYFGIIPLIGAILVLVALHGFARIYKENGIYDNALYGIIAGIVGVVLSIAIGIAIVLPNIKDFLMKLYPSWNGNWSTITSFSGMTPNTSNISFGDIIPFITAAIVILVIFWVFAIIATVLYRRSLKQLSAKTNEGLFSTTGMLLLIGAVLIIVGFGIILLWIATLILAIAFFKMNPQPEQPVAPAPPPQQTKTPV